MLPTTIEFGINKESATYLGIGVGGGVAVGIIIGAIFFVLVMKYAK